MKSFSSIHKANDALPSLGQGEKVEVNGKVYRKLGFALFAVRENVAVDQYPKMNDGRQGVGNRNKSKRQVSIIEK